MNSLSNSMPRYSWFKGLILHLLTGVIATVAHYGAMWIFLQVNLSSLKATSLGFLFGALTRFLLSYFHVFSPSAAMPVAAGRFMVALSTQFAFNTLMVASLLNVVPVWYAQVITTLTLTLFNYIVYRIWVFK